MLGFFRNNQKNNNYSSNSNNNDNNNNNVNNQNYDDYNYIDGSGIGIDESLLWGHHNNHQSNNSPKQKNNNHKNKSHRWMSFGWNNTNNTDDADDDDVGDDDVVVEEKVGWCRWWKVLWMSVLLVMVLGVVPYVTIHAVRESRPDYALFYSAGAFVVVTMVISSRQMYTHLTHWYMPDVQKYVVRILWMVPLYAFQSWMSLCFYEQRLYIDALRDLYEAYVIQSFLYYLVELLGGDDALVWMLQSKDPHYGHHGWLLTNVAKIQPWQMGLEFMLSCKHGVLQYVFLKVLATVATLLLQPLGLYGDGQFDCTKGYVYISAVINLSQMYALYCLVKFYHATRTNLQDPVDWKPLGKFLCIKGVVFFTWWQGILLDILQHYGYLTKFWHWTAQDLSNVLQDYLVCVEMFFFAIAHSYTFTYKEYLPHNQQNQQQTHKNYTLHHDMTMNQYDSPTHKNNENINNHHHHHQNNKTNTSLHTSNHRHLTEEQNHQYSSSMGSQDINDDDNDNQDEEDYKPNTIRTLYAPMRFRDAFWSTALPNETLNDMKLLRNGVSDQIMMNNRRSTDVGLISMASMQHAESI